MGHGQMRRLVHDHTACGGRAEDCSSPARFVTEAWRLFAFPSSMRRAANLVAGAGRADHDNKQSLGSIRQPSSTRHPGLPSAALLASPRRGRASRLKARSQGSRLKLPAAPPSPLALPRARDPGNQATRPLVLVETPLTRAYSPRVPHPIPPQTQSRQAWQPLASRQGPLPRRSDRI